ncbi:hypothetical protein GCM10009801_30270 [Streptomyces albiaxialis]|uniref:Lipoprotein n=1 Tax=Streptomyces albiaxialis TaxID=329523 RepID=A0ABN2VX10_9ACTN
MPAHEPERQPSQRRSRVYETPSPSMSALLASCAAADAVSRPPEEHTPEEAEPPVPAPR